ncbi:MAG: exodeoxyribonuclease alpha subunit, partial [Solirubrobacteraceae bacterium]|nr:exodeoxyribonuclease alpha subunit [Solirubrobacteraceae bacterium]
MRVPGTEADPFDVRRVARAPGLLAVFNQAGVLGAADVHVAARLARLAGETDEAVVLAAALAVRAPRLGHVLVDLAGVAETATVESEEEAVDLSLLPWPAAGEWRRRVAASGLVGVGEGAGGGGGDRGPAGGREPGGEPGGDGPEGEGAASRPLRLLGSWLYLDRYWREERQVADDLGALGATPAPDGVRMEVLRDGLERMFVGATEGRQCQAAATAVLRRLAIVAGGPGTGKTTTVARIVALIAEQAAAAGAAPPLVALAAPTGKAAARLEEAVHEEARTLAVDEAVRGELLGLRASTLHRLLGRRQDASQSRFRHHRGERLPHDVVIVDETSMVSLSMMARLVEAVRPDARLILVGDPGQLASIEAGAVLGDIVGPASGSPRLGGPARARLAEATGHPVDAVDPGPGAAIGDGIVVLERIHRFGGGIARLGEAIRRGDADAAIEVLEDGPEGVRWIAVDAADPASEGALEPVRRRAVAAARAVVEAARAGAARDSIAALGSFRILCAHRHGAPGVATWTGRIESWLTAEIDGFDAAGRWYVGRPLLVTENDYELRLYNGDTGVVVRLGPDRVTAAFERQGEVLTFSPTRLGALDTVYAMTIHKSQGSQFDTAAVLLPAPSSRILTRELLYTAATRARSQLLMVGTEEAIRA